jgi:hypothetical protein
VLVAINERHDTRDMQREQVVLLEVKANQGANAMKRFENRAEKSSRARNKAARCAERAESPTQEVANERDGKLAQAEAEEMMEPVGEIVLAAGEALHVDPRDLYNETCALIQNTLDKPNMISVTASEERMDAMLKAGVLETGLDAAESVGASNSLEKMLAHQMAASHKQAMKLVAQINDRMAPADAGRLTNAAARMMLTFQAGLLTLHKIRTGGKQVVVVQHVDVSSGGQAVVAGSMNAGVKGVTER